MSDRFVNLSQICKINHRSINKSDVYYDIKYLDTGSLTKNKIELLQEFQFGDKIPSRAKRKVKHNTILYSSVRPEQEHFGILKYPPQNLIVSTGFITLDVFDNTIDAKYLYYNITRKEITNYLHTVATNNVSAYPSINADDLGNLNLKIPFSIITQQKIAAVLSALDDKIELNNRINQELEAMAKTLYDYWFVQFDFPDAKGKPYRSSGGRMVYNQELKREIPEGWEVKKIKDIAKTGSGGTPLSTCASYYQNGTIPWINSGELNNEYIINTSNFITEEGLDNSSAKLFPQNTILVAMYGATAGKVSLANLPVTTNQAICAIIPLDVTSIIFLKFSLSHLYQYFIKVSTGSARDNLSQDIIKNINIVLPPKYLLIEYNNQAQSLINKIVINLKENEQLASLRDWLLPMLMNGQVGFRD